MKDLLIVGGGLAGASLAFRASQDALNFDWIISQSIPSASVAAYGICNPVNIRNATTVWNALALMESARLFYADISSSIQQPISKSTSILHAISDDELNFWRQQIETTDLFNFCDGNVVSSSAIFTPQKFIEIKNVLFVDLPAMLELVKKQFHNHIMEADFNFNKLFHDKDTVTYYSDKYQKIIFAEGKFGAINPYFSYLPFNPCKGEVIEIRLRENISSAIHSQKMLVPNLQGTYYWGSTYAWNDDNIENTNKGMEELNQALSKLFVSEIYEIINTRAGIRPTVSDRRPLLGWHHEFSNIGIMNGLGTKGIMYAPDMSKEIIRTIKDKSATINSYWDIHRFEKRRKKTASM